MALSAPPLAYFCAATWPVFNPPLTSRAIELRSDMPDYQLLTTIPGIGPINAMTTLAEAGDLRRFRHHRQFLKFCGMDLATVQSGRSIIPGGEAATSSLVL